MNDPDTRFVHLLSTVPEDQVLDHPRSHALMLVDSRVLPGSYPGHLDVSIQGAATMSHSHRIYKEHECTHAAGTDSMGELERARVGIYILTCPCLGFACAGWSGLLPYGGIYIYKSISIYTYIYMYIHIHIYVYAYANQHVPAVFNSCRLVWSATAVYMYMYIHICLYIYINVYMYVYVYIYTYIYIYIYTSLPCFTLAGWSGLLQRVNPFKRRVPVYARGRGAVFFDV